MEFQKLLEIAGNEPVLETGLLAVGDVSLADIRKQLSRWVAGGRLYQLRRGIYALAPPFQKTKPHPFLIANRLVPGSYVSCQSALAYSGLIPEYTPVVISVTTARPGRWDTPLGSFEYHHMQPRLMRGYRLVDLGEAQNAFVALPEKALLDLVYLHPGADDLRFLSALRLQNLERLNLDELRRLAVAVESPKLLRAADHIRILAETEAREYVAL